MKKMLSMLLIGCMFLMAFSVCALDNYDDDVEKMTQELKEVLETNDENAIVPVYIWYEDIQYSEIDNLVDTTVGIIESALIDNEPIPYDSIRDIFEKSRGSEVGEACEKQIREILNDTDNNNTYEKIITEASIMTERLLARMAYNEKAAVVLYNLGIVEEQIIFKSQYAPMIIANVTAGKVEKIIENKSITMVDRYEELEQYECSVSSTKKASEVQKAVLHSGLSGNGVKVGIIEGHRPDSSTTVSYQYVGDTSIATGDHPNGVMNIIGGTEGIAPSVVFYVTSGATLSIVHDGVEALLTEGVQVINASWGVIFQTSVCNWFDHIISQHRVTVIASAGNDSSKAVLCPSCSYNCISVGAIDDHGSELISNYTPRYESCYLNQPNLPIQKPDVVASDTFYPGHWGTSLSAPVVTGIVALLLELRPSLAQYPELVKAILMASCHYKAGSEETVDSGITERQGAGIVNAYKAISIVGRGQYRIASVENALELPVVQPAYGATKMNVSLAWNRVASCSGELHPESSTAVLSAQDLKLQVKENNSLIKESDFLQSSTEMIYFSLAGHSGTYKVSVQNNTSSDKTPFAIAWSTDTENFRDYNKHQSNPENKYCDGLFYLRNDYTNTFLTTSSNAVSMNTANFSNLNSQTWLLSTLNDATTYSIRSCVSPYNYLRQGTAYSGNWYNSGLFSNGITAIRVSETENNSYQMKKYISSSSPYYYLQVHQYSGAMGNYWYTQPYSPYANWRLDRLNYQLGDINRNGLINTTDSDTISNYLAGTTSLSAIQLYLADANADGQVNLQDKLYVLHNLSDADNYPL